MSDPNNAPGREQRGEARPPSHATPNDDMRDDDEGALEPGDDAKDAMMKTMTDQAKKAGDRSEDQEDKLNQDG